MSKVNRGKDFERVIGESFNNIHSISVDRLHDQMSGYAGSSNICDFIISKLPTLLYLECKSCYGNTLNFGNITDNQWRGLLEKSKISGVHAGVIIWFIDNDVTIYVPIQYLEELRNAGKKSFNCKKDIIDWQPDSNCPMIIPGNKKRIFFDYDMTDLIHHLTVYTMGDLSLEYTHGGL